MPKGDLSLKLENEVEWKLAKPLEAFIGSGCGLWQGGGGEGKEGLSLRSRGRNGGLSGGR